MYVKDNGRCNAVYGKTLLGFNFLNGIEKPGSHQTAFQSLNPAYRDDVIGIFQNPTEADLELALSAANDAFLLWREASLAAHKAILDALLGWINTHYSDLVLLFCRELGIARSESLYETQVILDFLILISSECPIVWREKIPFEAVSPGVFIVDSSEDDLFLSTFKKVLAIVFSGSTVVWLPSEHTSVSACVFSKVLFSAGLPAGVLNLVLSEKERGHYLTCQSPFGKIQKLSLCPEDQPSLIIVDDSALASSINASIQLAYAYSGQFGMQRPKIFVHNDVMEPFRQALLHAIKELVIGDPVLNHEIVCGPVASETSLNAFLELCQRAKAEGIQMLYGKGRMHRDNKPQDFVGDPDKGFYLWPVIWDDVSLDSHFINVQIKGPVMTLIAFDSLDIVLEHLKHEPYLFSGADHKMNLKDRSLSSKKEQRKQDTNSVLTAYPNTIAFDLKKLLFAEK